jgi:hypothetical protein
MRVDNGNGKTVVSLATYLGDPLAAEREIQGLKIPWSMDLHIFVSIFIPGGHCGA